MARGVAHSEETKQKAIAALLLGETPYAVAKAMSLPESSVRHWWNDVSLDKLAEIGAKRDARIEELLHDYLCENLVALRTQAELASDIGYLRKYPPSQLAELHRALAEKAGYLVEAINGVTRPEGSGGGEKEGNPSQQSPGDRPQITVIHRKDDSSTAFTQGAGPDTSGEAPV